MEYAAEQRYEKRSSEVPARRAVPGRAAGRKARRSIHPALWYFLAAAVVLVFALVYDQFSHGVRSLFMGGAFLIPLAGGIASIFLLAGGRARSFVRCALLAGVLTLTAGSILQGIFVIAGTASPFTIWYLVIGLLWLAAAGAARVLAR